MSRQIILQLTSKNDLDFIIKQLRDNQLPADDVPNKIKSLYIVEENNKKIGLAGLEILGNYGLVRSVVVNPALRNQGYGQSIINIITKLARLKKLKEIYLLTTTAERFFTKLNFKKINRDETPEEIKQTEEFNSLCPVTAVCMKAYV